MLAGWAWLLAAVVAGTSTSAAAAFADGQRAYDSGRFEEARRVWTSLAEAGEAEAQFHLGILYDLGRGTRRDPAIAYGWYRRAADTGLPEAQFNVAVMRDAGDGVARDPAGAATWYAMAAAHGHPRARYNLGQLYASGEGVPRNPSQAMAWFRAAARGGLSAATEKLPKLDERARPDTRPSGAEAPGELAAPVLVAPGPDAAVQARDGRVEVELVWVAPEQPVVVQFFVQVRALGDPGQGEVSAHYVDESATLLRLAPAPARYVWRVYAVAEGLQDYAVSGWHAFAIGDAY